MANHCRFEASIPARVEAQGRLFTNQMLQCADYLGRSFLAEIAVREDRYGPIQRCELVVVLSHVIMSLGCQVIDSKKIIKSDVDLKEIVGLLAGCGTTFAAFPDLLAMLKRRSSEGMNPRMGTIMGAFQILWVYYGLLIASRPVIIWNVIAVVINFLTVGTYAYFVRTEKTKSLNTAAGAQTNL